jgi:hypothetical protein
VSGRTRAPASCDDGLYANAYRNADASLAIGRGALVSDPADALCAIGAKQRALDGGEACTHRLDVSRASTSRS